MPNRPWVHYKLQLNYNLDKMLQCVPLSLLDPEIRFFDQFFFFLNLMFKACDFLLWICATLDKQTKVSVLRPGLRIFPFLPATEPKFFKFLTFLKQAVFGRALGFSPLVMPNTGYETKVFLNLILFQVANFGRQFQNIRILEDLI